MDPGNSIMRKTCLQSSMTALKEMVQAFPMVALNDTSTRLAVGDAIGMINNATISVYDMQRYGWHDFQIQKNFTLLYFIFGTWGGLYSSHVYLCQVY
jgi:hypothetical protein